MSIRRYKLAHDNYTENGISGIWSKNFTYLNETFETRGFIYFIATMFVIALSLVSTMVYVFSGLFKEEYHEKNKCKREGIGLSSFTNSYENIEDYAERPSQWSSFATNTSALDYSEEQTENIKVALKLKEYPTDEVIGKSFTKESAGKLNYLGQAGCLLREHIYRNKMTLKGKVLRVSYPKLSANDEGNFTPNSFFVTQRVTFGNDLNFALKTFFKDDIKLRRLKGQESTYIVFDGEEIITLEKMIAKTFMLDDFKISLTKKVSD